MVLCALLSMRESVDDIPALTLGERAFKCAEPSLGYG
jgi:hypothetical protein